MLYLLDANVLITAHNSYYPSIVSRVLGLACPQRNTGDLKVPLEMYEEVKEGGKDDEKDLC